MAGAGTGYRFVVSCKTIGIGNGRPQTTDTGFQTAWERCTEDHVGGRMKHCAAITAEGLALIGITPPLQTPPQPGK